MYQISKFVKNKSALECFLLRFELKILINCKKKICNYRNLSYLCNVNKKRSSSDSLWERRKKPPKYSWQLFDNIDNRAENVGECCACAWTKCLLAKRFKRTNRVGPWVFRTTRKNLTICQYVTMSVGVSKIIIIAVGWHGWRRRPLVALIRGLWYFGAVRVRLPFQRLTIKINSS